MKELCGAMLGTVKDIKASSPTFHPHVTTMTQYDEAFKDVPVLFPFQPIDHSLPEVLSAAGLKQFHCAETEKYAHITFFFSGGKEHPVKGEERKLIPSPKVDTYDQQPAMSCSGVADALVDALRSQAYDFLVCNLAAADMVGHTGVFDATVRACEAVDAAVGRVVEVVEGMGDGEGGGAVLLVTGDHGNAEEMLDEKGGVKTSHTTNLVPLIIVGKHFERKEGEGEGEEEAEGEGEREGTPEEKGEGEGKRQVKGEEEKGDTRKDRPTKRRRKEREEEGGLNDLAPTILQLLGVEQPEVMTGKSLLPK